MKKSDDRTPTDYTPSIFSFVKPQEVIKRKRSLEQHDNSMNLQAKRSKELQVASSKVVEEETIELPTSSEACSVTMGCLNCTNLQSKADNLLHEVSELRKKLITSKLCASEALST